MCFLRSTLWLAFARCRSERTSRKARVFWKQLETAQRDWSCPLCGWLCSFFGIACGSMAHETSGGCLEGERNSFFSKSFFFLSLHTNKKQKETKNYIGSFYFILSLFCFLFFTVRLCLKLVCGTCPWRIHNSPFCYESEYYSERKSCCWSLFVAQFSAVLSKEFLWWRCLTFQSKTLMRYFASSFRRLTRWIFFYGQLEFGLLQKRSSTVASTQEGVISSVWCTKPLINAKYSF